MGDASTEFDQMMPNACLQLRRAISFQAEARGYLRSMLSRRQLQGFVIPRRIKR